MIRTVFTSVLILFLVGSTSLIAQTEGDGKKLSKKELRAKRKKARQLEKLNAIYEIRKNAKELLTAKDFVLKDDGRSGSSGIESFFKIHGDTITIQTSSIGQTGGTVTYKRGATRVIGDIFRYRVVDSGEDKPLQVVVDYVERLTFEQRRAFVYVSGKRVEATFNKGIDAQGISGNTSEVAEIRGSFSSVADAKVWESGIKSSNVGGARRSSARQLGGNQ